MAEKSATIVTCEMPDKMRADAVARVFYKNSLEIG